MVVSQEQSYFFGTKPANNLLCYTKTLSKTSSLPAAISYTNANAKNINFVTMNADRYSTYGYTVDLTGGQLGTTSISYKLNGPSLLPYAITVNMYCDPLDGANAGEARMRECESEWEVENSRGKNSRRTPIALTGRSQTRNITAGVSTGTELRRIVCNWDCLA
uniref:Uncharacterized protein n=1 Tax=Anopheles atroparvus TaxID=41427 RepID=A0A182ITJ9_ANOAO